MARALGLEGRLSPTIYGGASGFLTLGVVFSMTVTGGRLN